MLSDTVPLKCQCEAAGYCDRRACVVSEVHWRKCQVGKVRHLDLLYEQAKSPGKSHTQTSQLSRIGDELAMIIKRETGESIPCSACKQEIARLNQLSALEVNEQRSKIAEGILDRGRRLLGWWQPKRWAINLAPNLVLGRIEQWIDEAIAQGASLEYGVPQGPVALPDEFSAPFRVNAVVGARSNLELSKEDSLVARGIVAGIKRSEVMRRRKDWQQQGYQLPQLDIRAGASGRRTATPQFQPSKRGHWSDSFRRTCIHFGRFHDSLGCSCTGMARAQVHRCNHPNSTPYCCATLAEVDRVRCSAERLEVTACEACGLRQTLPRYVSTTQYIEDIQQLLAIIPPDVTHIAGVSRSGIFAASMLSMLLHLPLDIIRQNVGDVVPGGHGWRLTQGAPRGAGKVLVVDDTCMTGNSQNAIRNLAISHYAPKTVLFATVYVNPLARSKPDLWAVDLPWPHILEWNLFNSVLLPSCALDFDGILCSDCPPGYDDDGERYESFLASAAPQFLVRRQAIPMVVTARLEKYRELTTAWLAKWGIHVEKLVMGPWDTITQRQCADVAVFKAEHYREFMKRDIRPGPHLFIESDPILAQRIAQLSQGIVVCPATKRCY